MENIRVQVLDSFNLSQRPRKIVTTQLLSGSIDENVEPMIMQSETIGDRWKVDILSGFMDPYSPKREQNWNSGRRDLCFTPLEEMREISKGEIFQVVSC